MKATRNIEDDVLLAAKEMAQLEGAAVGQVISALARRGLSAPPRKLQKSLGTRGGVPLLPSRGEAITLRRMGDLMDEKGV